MLFQFTPMMLLLFGVVCAGIGFALGCCWTLVTTGGNDGR